MVVQAVWKVEGVMPLCLEVEVTMPDQPGQDIQEKGWVAQAGSSMPMANSLAAHMPLLVQLASAFLDCLGSAKVLQVVNRELLANVDIVLFVDQQAQDIGLVARPVVQEVVDAELISVRGIVELAVAVDFAQLIWVEIAQRVVSRVELRVDVAKVA